MANRGPAGRPRQRPRAQPQLPKAFDPRPTKLGGTQAPAASSAKDKSEGRYNFLTCLACAQQCNIDFTGISWISTQGSLGEGGQAVVSQTRASLDTVLAFKRRKPSASPLISLTQSRPAANDEAFREICSEILALGHSEIRTHTNIVQLLAISWEIQDVKGWIWGSTLHVWPVMIFEKATHGDLRIFIETGEGKDLDVSGRIKVCADIASALAVVHKNDIIHGDIKPENALVFDGAVVKLADFGFSALASKKSIRLGSSHPWVAPEYDPWERYTVEQAKLVDLYSFGMLCLWVIFREKLAEMGKQLPRAPQFWWSRLSSWSGLSGGPGGEPQDPAMQLLKEINVKDSSKNKVQDKALELVDTVADMRTRSILRQFFEKSLAYKPKDRSLAHGPNQNLELVAKLLSGESSTGPTLEVDVAQSDNSIGPGHQEQTPPTTTFPLPSNFELSKALQALCLADFRVRIYVYQCLVQEHHGEKIPKQKSALAAQLAFCKKIGFGTDPDENGATSYLQEARSLLKYSNTSEGTIDDNYLQTQIDSCRALREATNETLRSMYSAGIIQPIHQGLEFRSAPRDVQFRIKQAREKEVAVMEKALRGTHGAILNLKWSLSTLLMESEDQVGPLRLLNQMVNDLKADPDRGVKHPDTVITQAYRSMARMKIFDIHHLEASSKEDRDIYDALTEIGLSEHVVSLMVCMHLSTTLSARGHFREAAQFLERAKKPTLQKFGPEHANTIMLEDQESDRLMREGEISRAAELARKTLQKMKSIVEADDMVLSHLRGKLTMLLLMTGQFEEAKEIIQETAKAMGWFAERFHPAFVQVLMPLMHVMVMQEKFDEAAKIAQDIISRLGGMPWPPEDNPDDSDVSIELSELLGTEDRRRAPYPNPAKLPKNPMLLNAEVLQIISLHANAHAETEGNPKLSKRLDTRADKELRKLMEQVDKSLGSAEWKDLGKSNGIAGSALRRGMDEEYTPLVELVASLGAQNKRDGLHYKKAIDISQEGNFYKITSMLEEHRALCTGTGASFSCVANLKDWLTGHWEGSYLYEYGGGRLEAKGLRFLELEVRDVVSNADTAEVDGTQKDEQGEWIIKGDANISGELSLRFYLKEGSYDQGWEYKGHVNFERKAIGGYWGFRGVERELSGGSFFYYKC